MLSRYIKNKKRGSSLMHWHGKITKIREKKKTVHMVCCLLFKGEGQITMYSMFKIQTKGKCH